MEAEVADIIDIDGSDDGLGVSSNVQRRRHLVFLITGNPGLVEYYRAFLATVYASLSESCRNARFRMYGASLDGFEVGASGSESRREGTPPYGLQEVIDGVERTLKGVIAEEAGKGREEGVGGARVILVGHSVGAYILLEIIRRCRGSLEGGSKIVGGICLFPTVTHIAKSSSGRKFSALFRLPFLPFIAAALVKLLTFCMPVSALQTLVRLATGFPPDAAATTAAFIKSKWGVWQALHMARDEMATITHDNWDTEIWGAATSPLDQPQPKLFFYFGRDDHWVADATRDELIAVRAYRGEEDEAWRPRMEIDETGIPHGFCIAHSTPVAETVRRFIKEIVEAEM